MNGDGGYGWEKGKGKWAVDNFYQFFLIMGQLMDKPINL